MRVRTALVRTGFAAFSPATFSNTERICAAMSFEGVLSFDCNARSAYCDEARIVAMSSVRSLSSSSPGSASTGIPAATSCARVPSRSKLASLLLSDSASFHFATG